MTERATALEMLEELNIPTDSFISAVRKVKAEPEKRHEDYRILVGEITGQEDFETPSDRYARFLYYYVVQEVVRAGMCDDEVFKAAVSGTEHFLEEYHFTYAWEDRAAEPKFNNDGTIKRKKGEKKEMAENLYKEIEAANPDSSKKELKVLVMTALQEKVGMTKAGSQTYFYNAFKKFQTVRS
jgi:hypothetical protein